MRTFILAGAAAVLAAATAGLNGADAVSVEIRAGAGAHATMSAAMLAHAKKLAGHYRYDTGGAKVGEWVPPSPPEKESLHLKGLDHVPPPQLTANDLAEYFSPRFAETSASVGSGAAAAAGSSSGSLGGADARRRRLLQDAGGEAAAGLKPQKVPHNWFGSGQYLAPQFAIATGKEECDVCYAMLEDADGEKGVTLSPQLAGAEGAAAEPQGPQAVGQLDLCDTIDLSFKATCKGYSTYLQQCPSFVHNICHEDIGGSERLRAPCPNYLKCYYCLRINPLYCLDDE